jgi:hypothetical protein
MDLVAALKARLSLEGKTALVTGLHVVHAAQTNEAAVARNTPPAILQRCQGWAKGSIVAGVASLVVQSSSWQLVVS